MMWRHKVLTSVTTLMVAAAGLVAVHVPAASAAPLDLANARLQVKDNAAYLKANVKGLDDALPNVGVADIMAEANRTGTVSPGSVCNPAAVVDTDRDPDKPAVSVTKSFCWQDDATGEDDGNTKNWFPQGVTTVADAQADQKWGGSNQPILVSWYFAGSAPAGNDQKGVRVTFIDPGSGKYRHVLLAHPYENSSQNASYTSLRDDQTAGKGNSLHAGGITWYGNFLYVADTSHGLRVFDMRHIYDLKAAGDKGNVTDQGKVGRIDGVFYGYGYRYVMPEVTEWEHATTGGTACTDSAGSLKFSYTSLDRSGTDTLLAGEYCNGSTKGRVASWDIADATSGGEQRTSGSWNAKSLHTLSVPNVNGATRFGGRWYVSQTHGDNEAGQDDLSELFKMKPVTSATGTLVKDSVQPEAIGAEALSHWPFGTEDDPTLGTIWTASEHPDRRMVYATLPH